MWIEAVFWISVLLLLYIHAGYAALVMIWARLRERRVARRSIEPAVSVLLVAFNEGPRIGRRIRNLLASDYPPDRMEILVGSDGSTDDTVATVHRWAGPRVRLHDFPHRRGKPAVLNDLARLARGDILVLADARQWFDRSAIRSLARCFADPRVGAVSGELILLAAAETSAVGEGVGFYWRLEKRIRHAESRIDSSVGATGAIYAIRRELFEPLPVDTLLDDVLVPMRVVARGYRVLFEPAARAFDRVAGRPGVEMARKIRTIAGNWQLFWREKWMLQPWRNRIWVQTVSHKVLRLWSPVLMAAALLSSVALAGDPFYRAALAAQGLFYACAAAGSRVEAAGRLGKVLSIPYTLCLLNWATIMGLVRLAGGRQNVTWERAAPPSAAGAREAAARRRRTA